jgi:hypothetical protein
MTSSTYSRRKSRQTATVSTERSSRGLELRAVVEETYAEDHQFDEIEREANLSGQIEGLDLHGRAMRLLTSRGCHSRAMTNTSPKSPTRLRREKPAAYQCRERHAAPRDSGGSSQVRYALQRSTSSGSQRSPHSWHCGISATPEHSRPRSLRSQRRSAAQATAGGFAKVDSRPLPSKDRRATLRGGAHLRQAGGTQFGASRRGDRATRLWPNDWARAKPAASLQAGQRCGIHF